MPVGCDRATCFLKQSFEDYARGCFEPGRSIAAAANELMHKIHREFKYVAGSTTNRTSIVEVLKNRRGVCQDFAHFMIACLRSCGLAARYVSGYIRTARRAAKRQSAENASMLGVVYCPPFGLVGFRSDQQLHGGEDHVTLAWAETSLTCRRFAA